MRSVETMEIRDKKQLVKLVSYIVMGDGGLYITGRCDNAKFIMNMKKENQDYILYCKDILENVTSVKIYNRKDYNTDGCNRKPQLRIETKVHPFFTAIKDRIYTDKYKGIDPHALKMLDAEALAILYMCDGSLHIEEPNEKKGLKSNSYNVSLNMKRLSYGDQFILKKALKEYLDLEWNINQHGKYWYLRLRCKDVDKFMTLIEPHILPSFQYKLKEEFRTINSEKSDDDIVRSA